MSPGHPGRRRLSPLDFRPPPACHTVMIPESPPPAAAEPSAPRRGRSFATFDLPEPVAAGIRAAGFTHCTPIQEKVLPLALAGRDVAGQAQTGTGKTAAFLITILTRLPPYDRRQSMLFSATLSYDVMELAYVFMNDAVRVSVTPEQVTAEKVEHLVYHVAKHEKLPLLVGLLRREPVDMRVLVFVNMRRAAERLVRYLEANGFAAAAITGDVDQRRRLAILSDFREGRLPILVATDVASRGLHIEALTPLLHSAPPRDA